MLGQWRSRILAMAIQEHDARPLLGARCPPISMRYPERRSRGAVRCPGVAQSQEEPESLTREARRLCCRWLVLCSTG